MYQIPRPPDTRSFPPPTQAASITVVTMMYNRFRIYRMNIDKHEFPLNSKDAMPFWALHPLNDCLIDAADNL